MNIADQKSPNAAVGETTPTQPAEQPKAAAAAEPAPEPKPQTKPPLTPEPPVEPYRTYATKDAWTAAVNEALKKKESKLKEVEITAEELAEKVKVVPELEAKLAAITDERKLEKWAASGLNPKLFDKFKGEIVLERGKDNIAELKTKYDLDPPIPASITATASTIGGNKDKKHEFINLVTGRPVRSGRK